MLRPIPDHKIYSLVDRLYEAAMTPGGWQRFFNLCEDIFPGLPCGLLLRRQSVPGGFSMVYANFPPDAVKEFLASHALSSPWTPILRKVPPGMPFSAEDHVPLSTIKHSQLYRRFMKPYGIGNIFGMRFHVGPDGRAMFVIACGAEAVAALQPQVMEVLERLGPHLERALELSSMLRQQRVRGLEDGLARQADPVFVLNQMREVIFMNAAARGAVEKGAVHVDAATGQFRLPSRGDMASFKALEDKAQPARGVAQGARQLMTFSLPAQKGPSVLEILRLDNKSAGPDDIFHDTRTEPHALVTLRFRDALRTPTAADIRLVLGLSKMEADAALALAEGRSVEQHAHQRGVAVETVRWHLKNTYQRTGCAGQAELLRLLLSLVGPPRLS